MGFEIIKYRRYSFACIILVCCACKNDDPELPVEGSYTKEWVLDINEYLGLNAGIGKTYGAVVIDDSRLLVSHNTGTTGSLVEINHADGSFVRNRSTDQDSIRLVSYYGTVALVHEQNDTKTYTLGSYESDGTGDFSSTWQSSALSPLGGELMGLIPDSNETIYTYGSEVDDDGIPQLWVANWFSDGTNRWKVTPDRNLDLSTFAVQLVDDERMIFSGQKETSQGKYWSVTSVRHIDGQVNELGPISTNLPILHIVKNPVSTWMYVFSFMGFSSLDHYGDEVFVNPMQEFETGTLLTRPLIMSATQLFLAVHHDNDITLASGTVQTNKWTEKYWEKVREPLILLATPSQDILVVSPNGFITKYRWNR